MTPRPQFAREALHAMVFGAALATAGPAWASQAAVPGLYDVIDVSSGDMLNVRAAPSGTARILGTLEPGARAVEVVGLDPTGRWMRVNLDERDGWVARRFLAARPGEVQGRIPRRLSCVGTEPFWRLDIAPTGYDLTVMGADPLDYEPGAWIPAKGRRDRWALRTLSQGRDLTAAVLERACSDGMSDRIYGLSVEVITSDAEGVRYLSGCCSLAP